MLVLTRRADESVDLFLHGKLIASVMTVEVAGRSVRLGFEAGPEITFLRRELTRVDDKEASR